MKKVSCFVFLAIMALAFTGYAEQGVWPNIGHTEWKKSEHGGGEWPVRYYREMWELAQKVKNPAPESAKEEAVPTIQSSKPELNPPVKDQPTVPVAVSDMPMSRSAPLETAVPAALRTDFSAPSADKSSLPSCAGGRCGNWVEKSGKFVWVPNPR